MELTEQLLLETVYRHTRKKLEVDETKPGALKAAANAALETIRRRVYGYWEEQFAFPLVLIILDEKSRMILHAHTKIELAEIVKPSIPQENYGRFTEGAYHVRAEEIILWSKASLAAPLNAAGYRRYMEVFTEYFPELKQELNGIR